MPVYSNSRLFFIHIPRTGGTSINRFFYQLGDFPHGKIPSAPDYHSLYGIDRVNGQRVELDHLTYEMAKGYLPKHRLHSMRVLCVVRDPYSRFQSEYRRQKKMNDRRVFEGIAEMTLDSYAGCVWELFESKKIFSLDHFSACHLFPQFEFIRDGFGIVSGLEIIRFESLEDGFRKSLKDLGIDASFELPRSNASHGFEAVEDVAYVRGIVSSIYAADYCFLGYGDGQ